MTRIAYIACLFLASTAPASQAVIQVYETDARAEPRVDAASVAKLIEGQSVTVSETSEAGWRRVRLPENREAWVADSALRLVESAPANTTANGTPPAATSQVTADAPVRSQPTPKPQIFVKDLAHLSTLVEKDETVHPMARRLESRVTTANVVGIGGGAAGGVMGLYGLVSGLNCDFGDEGCDRRSTTTFLLGAGLSAASIIASVFIFPNRGELLDVLNTWNTRHPDEPFTLDGVGGAAAQQ